MVFNTQTHSDQNYKLALWKIFEPRKLDTLKVQRSLLVIILFLMTTLLSFGQQPTDEQKFSVGVLTDNYPFSFREQDGQLQGFAYELLAEIEQTMGLNFERIVGTTDEINPSFKEGKLDLLQSFARSPERQTTTAFSVPYLIMANQIFVHTGQDQIKTLADLNGRKVLVHKGSVGEQILKNAGLEGSITYVESVEEALKMINDGEGDATLATRLSGLTQAHRLGLKHLKVLDIKIEGDEVAYCFAVQQSNHILLARINEGMAILKRTGQFDKLYQKWFGIVEPAGYTKEQIMEAVAIGLALALIIAIWALTWQSRMRKRIALQAKHLYESEEKYRSIFENSNIAILLTSPDGQIISANNFACKLFDRTEEEICKAGRNALIDDADPRVANLLEERKKNGHAKGELTLSKKDGSKFQVELSSVIFKDRDGQERTSIVIRDLTEQKMAEEALQESQGLYHSLVKHMPAGIFRKDSKGRYIFVNSVFCQLKGLNKEEILDKTTEELLAYETKLISRKTSERKLRQPTMEIQADQHHQLIMKTVKSIETEEVYTNPDGTAQYLQVIKSPVFSFDGKLIGTQGIQFDITERKQTESELIAAKEKAQESDRLKSAFLANISHEIRTPLNSIIGFSELISDPDFTAEQRAEFARLVNINGNILLTVISDIMDISKIEAGQIRVVRHNFSVNQLIASLQKEFSFNAAKKGIDIQVDSLNSNEDFLFKSDRERIRQVLTNLISNAVKFTEKGSIVIGTKITNDFVQFYVKDSGIGIPKAYHNEIFERFQQVESNATRKYGGIGLGLPISKSLVELLGGTIWVESEQGKGSTFYFKLPVA